MRVRYFLLYVLLCCTACEPLLKPAPVSSALRKQMPRAIVLGLPWVALAQAMGASCQLAGVDYSSHQLPGVAKLPGVGFLRSLLVNEMTALQPDIVIMSAEAGPRPQLMRLHYQGIGLKQLRRPAVREEFFEEILALGIALGRRHQADSLRTLLAGQFAAVDSLVARSAIRPQVLVIHGASGDALLLHGRGAPVEFLLAQVGAFNAAPHTGMQIIGPKDPLPDAAFLLVEDSTLVQLGGVEALKQHKRLRSLRAVQQGKVLGIPATYLYGPGPQAGHFCLRFAGKLHGLPLAP
ncbi:MAG: ABC transporter substrate-binding protein [Bacteroidetes bacterium]|nr:ABC transporter substrate-binding protein [Bacteroidota bacterium]